MNIKVIATTIIPTFKLSQRIFNYGDCLTNEKKDIAFVLTNKNPKLPLEIEFIKSGFFNITPKYVVVTED